MPSDIETHLAFTLDSLPIPAMLLDLQGSILAANPAALRVAGRPLVGTALVTGERWTEAAVALRRGSDVVDEIEIATPSGPLRLHVALSPGGHDLVRAFAIGDPVHAEPVRRIADEQAAAKQRLESLGLVAGGIAHDFNNLLVGVLAEASAAREQRDLAEGTREALRRIEAAARRMGQLTRQLLAYAGRGQFATVALDADGLVTDTHEQLARLVRAGVRLEIALGAKGAIVEADPSLLRQVVLELVANASDAGANRVAVDSRIVARDGNSWWQLEVGDDGAGIDAPTLARIFEPFFSLKAGRHGLGLSAVHGIVRRLGGDVEVDSRPGHGARFRVQLPVSQNVEVAPRRPSSSNEATQPARLTGVRCLVVDDEPSVRATVRRLLERRGATVVIATDGFEAEAHMRDEQFGLIVCDVSMPGRDGYQVLALARVLQAGVPVVLMSGYTDRARGVGGEEEPDAFLEKPFTARVLDVAIDEVLRR